MAFNWFKKNKKKIEENNTLPETMAEETMPEAPPEKMEPKAAEAEFELPDESLGKKLEEPVVDQATSIETNVDSKDPDLTTDDQTNMGFGTSEKKKTNGFFARLKKGLTKTRDILNTNIEDLFVASKGVDDNMLGDIEEMLITSDIGVQTSMEIIERISKKAGKIQSSKDLKAALKAEFLSLLPENPEAGEKTLSKPHVVMVVGVNGVGKTTTIGKLAAKLSSEHKKGLMVAADTFRAAAVEQLSIWAQRADVGIIKHKENADPAAVAFDGVSAAMARDVDTVYIDTAGRLHTKTNLMEELKKIKRSIAKKLPGAPHEILLVLDATTGQNAISQAKLFHEALGLTGIILTKLDGTAKGGIVLSICNSLDIPLKYVGVGESIEDLQTFDPIEFVDALI